MDLVLAKLDTFMELETVTIMVSFHFKSFSRFKNVRIPVHTVAFVDIQVFFCGFNTGDKVV